METPDKTYKLGPMHLAPGVLPSHVYTKLFAAFITIAMMTGMSFLQGYILTEHLNIPRREQGTLAGDLSFWTEVVAIFLIPWMGVLSDRIGRRPVYVFGIIMVGLGYGLYPFATTAGELYFIRIVIYAVGLAASSSMISALSADYPQENSRGKLIGFSSMMNILGTILMSAGIARIPVLVMAEGFDPIVAGQVMFLTAAGLCMVAGFVARLGLKPGTPIKKKERATFQQLAQSGLRAGKNPRIALAYAGAFAARSDLVIKGMFLALWAVQDARTFGMNTGEAMAQYGIMLAVAQGFSFFSAPLFGWYIDSVNRTTAQCVALLTAGLGYVSIYLIESPLLWSAFPYLLLITIGSGFMLKASTALIGQEAPIRERGSVIAMAGMFGALGILIFSKWGGMVFDSWGPWAPFVIAGIYQLILFVVGMIIRQIAPGEYQGVKEWAPQAGVGETDRPTSVFEEDEEEDKEEKGSKPATAQLASDETPETEEDAKTPQQKPESKPD